jgi:CRISP-associated protein Cas1
MLEGRLGLADARVPHADRHGLMWLERGKLFVRKGTLCFVTAGSALLDAGEYDIPYQKVSNVVIGPGSTVSHDALRLLARHGTGLLAVGSKGVRFYASMPFGPDDSTTARKQVELWSDKRSRVGVARRMYARRLGEALPQTDMDALRGVEGHRMKQVYKRLAEQHGVTWRGRRYDRMDPDKDDDINSAINHCATATRGAAMVAVASTGAVPQLGFIHEASGRAFALDIADLFRARITLPAAFHATKVYQRREGDDIERLARKTIGEKLRKDDVIPEMIDAIKELIHGHDDNGDA